MADYVTLVSSNVAAGAETAQKDSAYGVFSNTLYVPLSIGNTIFVYSLDITNPGGAWTQEASWAFTTLEEFSAAYDPVGNILHILAYERDGTGMGTATHAYLHRRFNCSTAAWAAAADTIVSEIDTGILEISVGGKGYVDCAWRPGDSTLVCVFSDALVSNMGQNYKRVSYATWTSGGGWTAPTALDAGGEVSYQAPSVEIFPTSERVLFQWTTGTSNQVRVLNPSTGLQATQTGTLFQNHARLFQVVNGAAERVGTLATDVQDFYWYNDADTPTETLGDTSVNTAGTLSFFGNSDTKDDIRVFQVNSPATGDVETVVSTDAGTSFSLDSQLVDFSVDIGGTFSDFRPLGFFQEGTTGYDGGFISEDNGDSTFDIYWVASVAFTSVVPVGTASVTGFAPPLQTTIPVPSGSLTKTGFASSLTTLVEVAAVATLMAGQVPTVDVEANVWVDVPSASITMSGIAPSGDAPNVVPVPLGSSTISGNSVQPIYPLPQLPLSIWDGTQFVDVRNDTLRVYKSDNTFTTPQSTDRLYRWDGSGWELIWKAPGPEEAVAETATPTISSNWVTDFVTVTIFNYSVRATLAGSDTLVVEENAREEVISQDDTATPTITSVWDTDTVTLTIFNYSVRATIAGSDALTGEIFTNTEAVSPSDTATPAITSTWDTDTVTLTVFNYSARSTLTGQDSLATEINTAEESVVTADTATPSITSVWETDTVTLTVFNYSVRATVSGLDTLAVLENAREVPVSETDTATPTITSAWVTDTETLTVFNYSVRSTLSSTDALTITENENAETVNIPETATPSITSVWDTATETLTVFNYSVRSTLSSSDTLAIAENEAIEDVVIGETASPTISSVWDTETSTLTVFNYSVRATLSGADVLGLVENERSEEISQSETVTPTISSTWDTATETLTIFNYSVRATLTGSDTMSVSENENAEEITLTETATPTITSTWDTATETLTIFNYSARSTLFGTDSLTVTENTNSEVVNQAETATPTITSVWDTSTSTVTVLNYSVRATLDTTDSITEVEYYTPETPTGFTATPKAGTCTDIDCAWTDNSAGESEFRIWRSTSQNGSYTQVGTNSANDTTFTDTSAKTENTTYWYYVTAYNASLASESAISNKDSALTSAKPSQPTGGSAVVQSNDIDVVVNWTDNGVAATSYDIEHRINGGGSTEIATGTTSKPYTHNALTALSTPTGASVTNVDNNELQINWTNGSNRGARIQIQYQDVTGSGPWTDLTTLATTATSYTHTGLSPSNQYDYRIRYEDDILTHEYRVAGINACGQGSWSAWFATGGWEQVGAWLNFAATTTEADSGVPQGITANVSGCTDIVVGWTDLNTTEDGYYVYRSDTGSGGTYNKVSGLLGINENSWTDTSIGEGLTRHYKVTSYIGGTQTFESALSAFAGATTNAKPGQPTGVTTTWIGGAGQDRDVQVDWTDNGDASTSYDIETRVDGGTPTLVGDNTASKPFTDNGVRAALVTPTTASITNVDNNELTLNWVNPAGNKGDYIQIQRNIAGAGWVQLTNTANSTVTSYTDTGLAASTSHDYRIRYRDNFNDTTYEYRVAGNNVCGQGPWSAWDTTPSHTQWGSWLNFTAVTTEADSTIPTGLSVSPSGCGDLQISWTDPGGTEDGFRLYRSTSSGGTYSQVGGDLGPNDTSYTDSGLGQGVTRYYKISSFIGGTDPFETAQSSFASGTTASAPGTPTSVAGTKSANEVSVNWTNNGTTPDNYDIQRREDAGAWVTKATNTTLKPWIDTDFESMSTPTGLSVTYSDNNEIQLGWTNPATNHTGIQVWRRIGTGSWSLQTTLGNTATTYTQTGLTAGTNYRYRLRYVETDAVEYEYRVRAGTSTCGDSAYSAASAVVTNISLEGSYTAETNTTLEGNPVTVTGVSATPNGCTQIDVTWNNNNTTEDGYRVYRSTTSGSGYVEIADLVANTTSYSDTGRSINTTYYYVVTAYVGGSSETETANSTEASATTPNDPNTPTSLVATKATNQVTLTWTDGGGAATSWDIQRSTDNVNWSTIAADDTGGSGYIDTGFTALSTPGTISYSAVDNNEILVSWSNGATYGIGTGTTRLQRRVAPSGSYSTVTTKVGNPPATSHDDQSVAASTTYTYRCRHEDTDTNTYYYRVRAKNSCGTSSYSSSASTDNIALRGSYRTGADVTTSANPVAPSISSVTAGCTSLTVNWNNVANETGYRVYVSDNNISFTLLATKGVNVTSHTHSGLGNSTTKYYKVSSYRGGDLDYESAQSASQGGTTTALPGTPTSVTSSSPATNEAQIDWTNTGGTSDNYDIDLSYTGTGNWVNRMNDGTQKPFTDSGLGALFLGTPGNPTNGGTTTSSITVNWTNSGEAGERIQIQRKTGAGGTYADVFSTTNTSTTSWNNTGLSSGTTYYYRIRYEDDTKAHYYRVRGNNGCGSSSYSSPKLQNVNLEGNWSGETAITTDTLTAPTAPNGLSVVNNATCPWVDLTWNDNSNNEDGFKVYRRVGAGSFTLIETLGANNTSYTDEFPPENTSCDWKVEAYNAAGGNDSNIAGLVTQDCGGGGGD